MVAVIPTGIGNAVSGGLIAGCFLLLGKAADWLFKRRGERKQAALDAHGDERAEEGADLARLRTMSDEAYRWAETQRARADEIARERDAMVAQREGDLAALRGEIAQLRMAVTERDAVIAAQATKLARLEREVHILKEHDRRANPDR